MDEFQVFPGRSDIARSFSFQERQPPLKRITRVSSKICAATGVKSDTAEAFPRERL